MRRTFECSSCKSKSAKFLGTCGSCGTAGTIIETTAPVARKRETLSARGLRRRSKNSERTIAKKMLAMDGVDPAYRKIATSAGRIGHITNIRADAVSLNYLTENKNRLLPKWLVDAWILIQQRAIDFNKHALLHIEPPNMTRDFKLNGVKYRSSTLHIITEERHKELIQKERELDEIKRSIE